MAKIRCNMCMWIGEEEDLKPFKEKQDDGTIETILSGGCPNCKTDIYLMDMKERK